MLFLEDFWQHLLQKDHLPAVYLNTDRLFFFSSGFYVKHTTVQRFDPQPKISGNVVHVSGYAGRGIMGVVVLKIVLKLQLHDL